MEFKIVNEKEYEKDRYSEPKDEVFEYSRRNPVNEDIRNNHNTLFLKRSLYSEDVHVREMLGYLIAKKCGIPVCETELTKYPTGAQDKYENAVISYQQLTKDERTMLPIYYVKKYREQVGTNKPEIDWILDIESILNTVFGLMQKRGRSLEEFNEFLQGFIDMMIFDITFVNSDRDHKNWYLRENMKTGKIELYPLFDNASIFATEMEYKENISEEEAHELSENHPLSILTFKDYMSGKNYSTYHDVLKYLLSWYPKETKKALQKVSVINEENLSEMIDSIPDVNPVRRDQMLKVFKYRKKGIEQIILQQKTNEKQHT